MASSFKLDQKEIKKNIEALQAFMQKENLDAFVVTSFDPYLNEYVPMENCHRFFVTNFSGSTAEVMVPKTGKVKLYVDGRYHEQADLEVDSSIVEVIKPTIGIQDAMFHDIKNNEYKLVGIEADRIPLNYVNRIKELCNYKGYFNQEMNSLISFPAPKPLPQIELVDKIHRGLDTVEKLVKVVPNKSVGYFITAIDSLAWITNCRGYHLPNLSSFLGRGFVTHDKVYVFIDHGVEVEQKALNEQGLEYINLSIAEVSNKLKLLQNQYNLSTVYYDPEMLNFSDYEMLLNVFGKDSLVEKEGGLVSFHAIKDQAEIEEIQRSFAKADKAIFNTINWVKSQVKANKKISELDLYHETSVKYNEQGSKEQSFNTIAGVGANGSIIHYGDPKKDVIINENDMILLDSGGYFEGGFATDTTRTFMASDKEGKPEFKRMYTLVLKAILQAQNAVFPENVPGIVIDALCRAPLFRNGENYAHGTGHGVGIHVHESGARLSNISKVPMKEGQVISIEPGLYKPGIGGVRLENIALVEKHPNFKGYLRFRSLVYIGFEPKLIDQSLLNDDEKIWLEEYEAQCLERGTSFR